MNNQYDIVQKILQRFDNQKILSTMVLVGSWCVPLYRDYYFTSDRISPLRTRDIDFLIPRTKKDLNKVDIPALLEDLGFLVEFNYPDGLMRLVHPDLIIEFLVPEIGRGGSEPYPIPAFSMNAQPLRAVKLLLEHTITLVIEGISITLPHPIIFGFQKIIASNYRHQIDKRNRDISVAIDILKICITEEPHHKLKVLFQEFTRKQQKLILKVLTAQGAHAILTRLQL